MAFWIQIPIPSPSPLFSCEIAKEATNTSLRDREVYKGGVEVHPVVCEEFQREQMTYLFYVISCVRRPSSRDVLPGVADGYVPQLVALVEHLVTNSAVDEDGQQDTCPDRYIVADNAEVVPRRGDPTPELSCE